MTALTSARLCCCWPAGRPSRSGTGSEEAQRTRRCGVCSGRASEAPDWRSRVGQQRKLRVAVIFGGRGPEHAVSCMGGGNLLASLDRAKYDVVPIGITTSGEWVQVADEPARLAISGSELPSVEA